MLTVTAGSAFDLRLTTDELAAWGDWLSGAAGAEAAQVLDDALAEFGEAWYAGAAANLEGQVLNIRTRRLRGALAKRRSWLEYELEDDVVYGVYWEEGFFDVAGQWQQRPWFGVVFEQDLGGEAGFAAHLDAALAGWVALS